jgi:HK97 gp10 family phage protein
MADTVRLNPKFAARLARIPPDIIAEAREGLRQSAEQITARMKANAPVDDGDLQMSITYRFGDQERIKYSQSLGAGKRYGANFKTKTAGGSNPLTVTISAGNTEVRYAHLVEFGTAAHIAGGQFAGAKIPAIPAQPFFYPIFRAYRRTAKNRVARHWRKAIKKAAQS